MKAIATGEPVAMFVTGGFFALGLYLIVGRFLYEAWQRRSMMYAVTDRRLLTWRFNRSLSTARIDELSKLELKIGAGGRGTIVFTDYTKTVDTDDGPRRQVGSTSGPGQFVAIADAASVLNLIERTRDAATRLSYTD